MFQSHSISQDQENWNVAGGYSQGLILMEFHRINKLETVATFGAENIDEAIGLDSESKNQRRIEALKFLNQTMQQLITQTEFAVMNKYKMEMTKALELIIGMRDKINKCYMVISDRVKGYSQFKIKEDLFNHLLSLMVATKRQVNKFLYKSGMIFPTDDGIDPDELKQNIMEDYVNSGG